MIEELNEVVDGRAAYLGAECAEVSDSAVLSALSMSLVNKIV